MKNMVNDEIGCELQTFVNTMSLENLSSVPHKMDYINNFELQKAPFMDSSYSLVAGAVYLIVVYSIRAVLGTEKKGEPAQRSIFQTIVKQFSIIHNAFLVVLSFVMMCGILIAAFQRTQVC
jgi:hypothetical protein